MARIRVRDCRNCNQPFSWEVGRGKARLYCRACGVRQRKRPACKVPECHRQMRSIKSGYCEMHYQRLRLRGTLAPRIRPMAKEKLQRGDGYILIRCLGHPMAQASGYAMEHRYVLFEKIGPGVHACVWCKGRLPWEKLVPDHLDGVKSNNVPENLVPSCVSCNFLRGSLMAWITAHKDDPMLWKMYEEARGIARL